MGEVWAIVVAGGAGTRLGGDVPKQFLRLGDHPLWMWAAAAANATCDGVVIVVPAANAGVQLGQPGPFITGFPPEAGSVVPGGPTRSASVRAGLAAVPDRAEIVVVHDAARPLATAELFGRVIAEVRAGADGAVPGIPVADTIKRVDATGRVIETPDRAALRAIQTPQAFSAAVLRRAHAGAGEATDDAALVEDLGATVVVVDGDPSNLKITAAEDLVRAEALLDRREA